MYRLHSVDQTTSIRRPTGLFCSEGDEDVFFLVIAPQFYERTPGRDRSIKAQHSNRDSMEEAVFNTRVPWEMAETPHFHPTRGSAAGTSRRAPRGEEPVRQSSPARRKQEPKRDAVEGRRIAPTRVDNRTQIHATRPADNRMLNAQPRPCLQQDPLFSPFSPRRSPLHRHTWAAIHRALSRLAQRRYYIILMSVKYKTYYHPTVYFVKGADTWCSSTGANASKKSLEDE